MDARERVVDYKGCLGFGAGGVPGQSQSKLILALLEKHLALEKCLGTFDRTSKNHEIAVSTRAWLRLGHQVLLVEPDVVYSIISI